MKRIAKLLLTLALVLLFLPNFICAVSAFSTNTYGTFGNGYWILDPYTGVLEIRGEGNMPNYTNSNDVPWPKASVRTVIIEDGITNIGDSAFALCINLTNVTIPNSVTIIGDSAFARCKLSEILLPDSITHIGEDAFFWCSSLKKISIPESVISIGQAAFSCCESLTDIVLPDALVSLGDSVFKECDSLTSITFPKGLSAIGDETFYGCKNLENITIPDSVIAIGDYAFYECPQLMSVKIGDSVVKIGDYAFCNCDNLISIELPERITNIGEGAFSYCDKLNSIMMAAGVVIGEDAFRATKIMSIVVPHGTTTIGSSAFWGCSDLIKVTLPVTLTNIGDAAFGYCENLDYVYYEGTRVQKTQIQIGDKNGRLTSAEWHYEESDALSATGVSISSNTRTGKPKLSWESIDGAAWYRIYRAESKSDSYSYLDTSTTTSYTDETAKLGINYYYKIKAVNSDTASAYSNIVNRVCDLPMPNVTLKVDTASGKPKITLKKISGAEKYYIVRSTSRTGIYTKLATITGSSYIDTSARTGKTYYYKVKALHAKDAADSAYSAVTSRVCDLKKPVVTITRNSSGNPWLKWEAISGAEKYEVYRATSKSGTYKLVKTTVTATSFADKTATAGKTYYYKVRAIHEKEAANSAYSAIKYIKAK